MDTTKKDLKARYKKAIRRVERESDILDRARDRKTYWSKVSRELEKRLNIVQLGQLEFAEQPNNQGEVS